MQIIVASLTSTVLNMVKKVIHEHRQLIAGRIQAHMETLSVTEQTALTHHLQEMIRLMIKAGIITPDDQSPLNQVREDNK